MSTNAAPDYAYPGWLGSQPAPDELPGRRIEVVPSRSQRRARPRVVYALVTMLGLFLIVVSQLLLSVALSDGAYVISSLQEQEKVLSRTYQSVSQDLHRVSSPQNLAANAEALGMVSNTSPVYLRLSDGAVLGVPTAAAEEAGSLIGASGNLIPNSLLEGVPLITEQPKGADSANSAGQLPADDVSAPPAPVPLPQLPLAGVLPSPTTR